MSLSFTKYLEEASLGHDNIDYIWKCPYCETNCLYGCRVILCFGSNDALRRAKRTNHPQICYKKAMTRIIHLLKSSGVTKICIMSIPVMEPRNQPGSRTVVVVVVVVAAAVFHLSSVV